MTRLICVFVLSLAALVAQNPETPSYPTSVATDVCVAANSIAPLPVLSGSVDASTTTLTLDRNPSWPTPACLRIDNEVIHCAAFDSSGGYHFTSCTRGTENTTPTTHNDQAQIHNVGTPQQMNRVMAELRATQTYAAKKTDLDPLGRGYCVAAYDGGANSYTCSFTTGQTGYVDGTLYRFMPGSTNSAASPSANLNGWGPKTIYDPNYTVARAGRFNQYSNVLLMYSSAANGLIVESGSNAIYFACSGVTHTSNAYTCGALAPFVIATPSTGDVVTFLPDADNTGAVTLAWGTTTVSVTKSDGTALTSGDLKGGQPYMAIYYLGALRLLTAGSGSSSGGSGVSTNAEITDWLATSSSGTLTLGASCSSTKLCVAEINGTTYSFSVAMTAVPTGTGTAKIGISSSGVRTVWHNGTGMTCTNCTAVASTTSFPSDAKQLWSWNFTSGVWAASGTDLRASAVKYNLTPSNGILIAGYNIAGDPSVLMMKNTDGTFTVPEISTPSGNPASGNIFLYPSSGKLCAKSSSGVETCTGGSGSGTITLSGDVSGATATTSVDKIKGRAVASTAPTNGQVLAWNSSSSQYQPTTPATGTGGGFLTAPIVPLIAANWTALCATSCGTATTVTGPTGGSAIAIKGTTGTSNLYGIKSAVTGDFDRYILVFPFVARQNFSAVAVGFTDGTAYEALEVVDATSIQIGTHKETTLTGSLAAGAGGSVSNIDWGANGQPVVVHLNRTGTTIKGEVSYDGGTNYYTMFSDTSPAFTTNAIMVGVNPRGSTVANAATLFSCSTGSGPC